MTCREYIIEFEDRGTPSETAELHLTVCAECRQTSERQTRLWLMFDEIKPVAAPPDFDFHVRARIAQGQPEKYQKSGLAAILRYVLPLSVAVLLLGLFVFSTTYFSGNQPELAAVDRNAVSPAPVAETAPVAAPPIQSNFTVSEETAPTASPNKPEPIFEAVPESRELIHYAAARNAPVKIPTRPRIKFSNPPLNEANPESEITSRDIALRNSVTRLPAGFGASDSSPKTSAPEAAKPIEETQFLQFIGVETVTENAKRTVKTVAKDSLGERSGVRVGDVIESVGDTTIGGKSVIVTRDSEKIEIPIKSAPNP